MDGVRVGDFGRGDDPRDVEVAFLAGGGSDADRLVGETHVEGVAVGAAPGAAAVAPPPPGPIADFIALTVPAAPLDAAAEDVALNLMAQAGKAS